MRISDWSSDVCSSDLELTGGGLGEGFGELDFTRIFVGGDGGLHVSLELGGELGRRPVTRRDDDEGFHFLPALLTGGADYRAFLNGGKNGIASCWECACQYVSIPVFGGKYNKTK